ncbi:unnamed protein product [Cunninghamella echinulata]
MSKSNLHCIPTNISTNSYYTARSYSSKQEASYSSGRSVCSKIAEEDDNNQQAYYKSQLRRHESKHQTDIIATHNSLSTASPYPTAFDQLIPVMGNTPIFDTSLTNNNLSQQHKYKSNYVCTGEPDQETLPHYVLLPIGKTGDGKSSLLNSMFGYEEFKAAATAKSVTDTVVERTGCWTVNKLNTIVTAADTPGFADSAGRDFTKAIQDYILDVSDRIGIDAFLLVFQFKSTESVIMNILKAFSKLMEDIEPNDWWDHVILVFTRFDYTKEPQTMVLRKTHMSTTLCEKIKETFQLEKAPRIAFVSSKNYQCPLLFGKECDCEPVRTHQHARMRLLKEAIAKCSEHGRWHGKRKRTINPPPSHSSSSILNPSNRPPPPLPTHSE